MRHLGLRHFERKRFEMRHFEKFFEKFFGGNMPIYVEKTFSKHKTISQIVVFSILLLTSNLLGVIYAADGDFATFREATGGENIAQSASITDITWDTTVSDATSTYTLQANTFDIDLADAGKYLVLYSIPTEEVTLTNSERTDAIAWLELAGTDLAYGYSQSYIRRNGGNFEGYNAGAAIIDASAGDDLSIEMQRRDTNTDTTERRANKSGISLLKLDNTWDYLRLSKGTGSSDISGNTSFTPVTWDTQDEVDSGSFAHSTGTNPDQITVSGAAGEHFLVTANVSLKQNASSNNRQNYEMMLALDGTEIEGTRVTTYIRGNSNSDGTYNGVLAYSGIITKQVGTDETLTVQVRRESEASATTNIVGGETAVSIVKLPITADYVRLTEAGGGQDLSTSRTVITWDTTVEEDSASFEHDTTNTERVNIDAAGDYLFFSTMYAARGSTTDGVRETQFLEWRLDGTTLMQYGNHGAFNRGDQGTGTDAYTSGSSGGILLNGLADTQFVELTQINEAANATSTYQAGRMALQGVNIASLFAAAPDTRQLHYRWRDDTTDLNTAGGWLDSEDSSPSTPAPLNTTYRLRLSSANVGGTTEMASKTYELQYGAKPQGGACLDVSTWTGIGDSSDDIDMVDTTNISPDGESTNSGLLANSEGYTYVSGEGRDSGDTTGAIGPLLAARYTELEYSFEFTNNATLGETYCFRLYDTTAGAPLNAYNFYPELTTVEPRVDSLHFRWRDDSTDLNTSGGWLASEDSNVIGDINRYDTYRVRMEIANTGTASQFATIDYELEWATMPNSGSCSDSSSWTGIGDATDEFAMANTTNIDPDGETISSGLLANSETYNFENGEARDTADTTTSIGLLDPDDYTELEYSITATDTAVTGETYCFRLYNSTAGATLDSYSNYPTVTLNSSSISYTPLEWGTQSGVDDDSWTTINFTGTYTNPVFVCSVEYKNNIGNESDGDADAVVCRVQNVGSTSAQVMLQEPGAPGSLTQAETIHWIVAEEGAYDNADIKFEAFTYNSTVTDDNGSWVGEQQTPTQSYTNPVVIGQVMTYNDSNYSVFWAGDGGTGLPTSANIYTGKHVAEDPNNFRADETVGVIIFEQGNGTLGGIEYEVRLPGQTIDRIDDSPPSTYTFNQTFSSTPTVGVVSQAGMSGVNGGHPVLYDDGNGVFTTSTIDLVIMEDEIADTEQTGNTEAVAYIVFGQAGSATVSMDQTNYRFYQNIDNIQPSTPLNSENGGITDIISGEVVRLRMAIQSGFTDLPSDMLSFKLQYGAGSDCSAVASWVDVDAISGSGIWRGYNNATPTDGATIAASLLNSQTNSLQTYEEENDTTANPNQILEGTQGEWDFVLQNNGAVAETDYCFRMVTSDDTTFVYSTYPQITTAPSTLTQQDFEWFVPQSSVTVSNTWPTTTAGADLNENEVLTQIPGTNSPLAFGDKIRIQVNFSVADSPVGVGEQAFKLQYSEGESCAALVSWNDVGAKGSGSIWRFYDETGLSDTVTQVNQISSSDTGTEGNYTEINPSTSNPNSISVGQTSEWDFPIENNGATDNVSYCFRMVLSDDTEFDTYNNYPRLYTHPGMTALMRHGNFYRSDSEQGFMWVN